MLQDNSFVCTGMLQDNSLVCTSMLQDNSFVCTSMLQDNRFVCTCIYMFTISRIGENSAEFYIKRLFGKVRFRCLG